MIIKLAFAFGAWFISFLTPCVLPIIPGYISYITGKNLTEIDQDKKIVLIKTILFSLGFSLVFIALGVSASAVGCVFLFFSYELRIAAGIIGNTQGVKKLINPAPKAKASLIIILSLYLPLLPLAITILAHDI